MNGQWILIFVFSLCTIQAFQWSPTYFFSKQKAEQALKNNNLSLAKELYVNCLMHNEHDHQVMYNLARINMQEKNFDQAELLAADLLENFELTDAQKKQVEALLEEIRRKKREKQKQQHKKDNQQKQGDKKDQHSPDDTQKNNQSDSNNENKNNGSEASKKKNQSKDQNNKDQADSPKDAQQQTDEKQNTDKRGSNNGERQKENSSNSDTDKSTQSDDMKQQTEQKISDQSQQENKQQPKQQKNHTNSHHENKTEQKLTQNSNTSQDEKVSVNTNSPYYKALQAQKLRDKEDAECSVYVQALKNEEQDVHNHMIKMLTGQTEDNYGYKAW